MSKSYFIRESKNRDFTIISNIFLRDVNLSWKAKGLFSYLLSLPDNWKIYLCDLESRASDGETSLRSAINELIEKGYVIREQQKDESGKWSGYSYLIIENPLNESFHPKGEKPYSDFPDMGFPDMENQALVSTKEVRTKEIRTKDSFIDKSIKEFPKKSRSLLDPKKEVDKRYRKSRDIQTMRSMIDNFSQDPEIREWLLKYFEIRIKKGLTPVQWEIILEDLTTFSRGRKGVIIDKIRASIAGGYLQIIASWEKPSANNRKTGFDNTERSTDQKSSKEIKEYFSDPSNLSRDENGEIEKF